MCFMGVKNLTDLITFKIGSPWYDPGSCMY